MTLLIAETAWHHQGDYEFMVGLLNSICQESDADVIKLHISLDLDEYMSRDHTAYETLKSWMFSPKQWEELIGIVRLSGKGLMLLLNDTSAIEFATDFKPEIIELHSVCLNVPSLQNAVLDKFGHRTPVVIGVGGCSLQEVDAAVRAFEERDVILMFGFQNYPTRYEDVNLSKIRKIQRLYADKRFGYADHTGWDEPSNDLITLMVAANGMDYVEKHVTTVYGQERCDFAAAVSIEMFNDLAKKIKLIDKITGDGSMALNAGEKSYSKYGPMKMAGVARNNISEGSCLEHESFLFCRTGQKTAMSQIDITEMIGKKIIKDIQQGQVIDWYHFAG